MSTTDNEALHSSETPSPAATEAMPLPWRPRVASSRRGRGAWRKPSARPDEPEAAIHERRIRS